MSDLSYVSDNSFGNDKNSFVHSIIDETYTIHNTAGGTDATTATTTPNHPTNQIGYRNDRDGREESHKSEKISRTTKTTKTQTKTTDGVPSNSQLSKTSPADLPPQSSKKGNDEAHRKYTGHRSEGGSTKAEGGRPPKGREAGGSKKAGGDHDGPPRDSAVGTLLNLGVWTCQHLRSLYMDFRAHHMRGHDRCPSTDLKAEAPLNNADSRTRRSSTHSNKSSRKSSRSSSRPRKQSKEASQLQKHSGNSSVKPSPRPSPNPSRRNLHAH